MTIRFAWSGGRGFDVFVYGRHSAAPSLLGAQRDEQRLAVSKEREAGNRPLHAGPSYYPASISILRSLGGCMIS